MFAAYVERMRGEDGVVDDYEDGFLPLDGVDERPRAKRRRSVGGKEGGRRNLFEEYLEHKMGLMNHKRQHVELVEGVDYWEDHSGETQPDPQQQFLRAFRQADTLEPVGRGNSFRIKEKSSKRPRSGEEFPLNDEQRALVDCCMRPDARSVFVTGAPGTGKSHVLQALKARLIKEGRKEFHVTAPTGIAASHIEGITLHSFAAMKPFEQDMVDTPAKREEWVHEHHGKLLGPAPWQQAARRRFWWTKILIIDEISMVSGEFLDILDLLFRKFHRPDEPFGGVRVIAFGDFLQLPPVEGKFAFEADCWPLLFQDRQVKLSVIHRQKDGAFLDVLSDVRMGKKLSRQGTEMLQTCLDRIEDPEKMRIFPTNDKCFAWNKEKLSQIDSPEVWYERKERSLPQYEWALEILQGTCTADERLCLKVGARVLLLRNLELPGLVNGSLGIVEGFSAQKGEVLPIVRFDSGDTILVGIEEWSYECRVQVDPTKPPEEIKVAWIDALPLKLAWGITVHKSQGMTLDEAEVHAGDGYPAQAYVAMSRLRSSQGLRLIHFGKYRADACALHWMAKQEFGSPCNLK